MKLAHLGYCWVFFVGLLLLAQLAAAQSPSPTITFLFNSGLDDVTLPLSDSQVNTIAGMLQSLRPTTDPNWTNLGWRGFEIENPSGSGPLQHQLIVVFKCVIEIADDNGTDSFFQDVNGSLFAYLAGTMYTAPGLGPFQLPDIYVPSCASPTSDDVIVDPDVFAPAASPWPTNGSEPNYQPGKWNKATVRPKNNCYNYSTNKKTNTFAQPGRASSNLYQITKCKDAGGLRGVETAAKSDGLAPQDCTKACPKDTFKVSLVVDPVGKADKGLKPDYHWYQQNPAIQGNKGYFSHKPGKTKALPTDAAGNLISTPATANRMREGSDGNLYPGYTDFCGCFCVDPTKVRVR